MKINSIIVLLLLVFISSYSYSQDKNQINLKWKDNFSVTLTSKSTPVLYFEGAEFNSDNSELPVFSDRIPVKTIPLNISLELNNTVYEAVSADKLTGIELSSIQDDIEINSSISTQKKKNFIQYSFVPLRKNSLTGVIERLVSFSINHSVSGVRKLNIKSATTVTNSILSSGIWVKIGIAEDGVYKITNSELSDMGIANPSQVKLFGSSIGMLSLDNSQPFTDDLEEISIKRESDFILFYAKGPVNWKYSAAEDMYVQEIHRYSTQRFYFLSSDAGTGKEIIDINSPASFPTHQVNSFDDFQYHEREDTNLIKSGRVWYGEEFGVLDNIDFDFVFDNIITSEPVRLRSSVIARSTQSSSYNIEYNNSNIALITGITPIVIDPDATYAYGASKVSEFLPLSDNITLDVQYNKPNSSAKGWLNYLCLNVRRELLMSGNQMIFRDTRSVGAGNITEFQFTGNGSELSIWDITELLNVKDVNYSQSGNNILFKTESDELHEFIAFKNDAYLSVEDYELVENQNIHGESQPDYIIVAPEIFIEYAEDLANLHREEDNMDVLVVSNDQVYNEFSSGTPDVTAIKNMVRMFYHRASGDDELPGYLLLFGDGSYDNLDARDVVLTYQSSNSLNPINSFCTDDFFGYMDDTESGNTGALDISIGRLPVSSEIQAQQAINKIRNYYSPETFGDWRNVVCFIADDSDNQYSNSHMDTAEDIATLLHLKYPILNFDKIYLDAYPQIYTASGERYPDAEVAIQNRLDKGALVVNYTGHGNELGLTHEQVIGISDILNWDNFDRLPLFMTATCEFSRFDDPGRTSGGELVFLNPNGGGIALSTTTRPVYPSSLSYNFYSKFYEKVDDEYYRVGDLLRLAKNSTGSDTNVNKKKFVILGDPALKLAYPEFQVYTTKINGVPISENIDTLKALSLVTIEGNIGDDLGNVLTEFSGFVYPTVYDKSKLLLTLGNEGNTPMSYFSQKNILYKGKSSVTDGIFTFSFVVPKDISYDFGYGKLSYYAGNDSTDAAGYNEDIIIGGSSDIAAPDDLGPEISLFMNSDNFVSGGITNENPKILVYVNDSSGINTVGNGIGHDIIAVLNDNTGTTFNMNDNYEADVDSYQSGRIEYPLSDLEKGNHSLRIKVWDVCNNSSVDSLEFVVAESADMAIEHLLNYPNPFTESTDFYFEHNQINTDMDVLVQIFTISGRIVKTLYYSGFEDGFRIGPIHWDGLDDFGNKLGRGVYIYKVSLRTAEGRSIEKMEKLVILK